MLILVVEDDRVVQMVAKHKLSELGRYEIDIAGTAAEAIEKTLTTKYDVILMDIGLDSNNSGFDVTVEIKNGDNPNKETPIIAVTAHEGEKYRTRAKEVGMVGFMNKPANWPKLDEMIKELVK